MFCIFCFKFLKHGNFISLSLMNEHEFFNSVEVIMHCHTILHNFLFFNFDSIKFVKRFLHSNYSWICGSLGSLRILRNRATKLLTGFAKKLETSFIRIKLLFDSDICSFGHIHLTLVVKDTLFVLSIHRGRRGSVELGTILSAELSIFGFFFIDDFLTSCNHISIDLADRFISLNCLGEVLRGSFFLELLNL